jgi:hypothetical protein
VSIHQPAQFHDGSGFVASFLSYGGVYRSSKASGNQSPSVSKGVSFLSFGSVHIATSTQSGTQSQSLSGFKGSVHSAISSLSDSQSQSVSMKSMFQGSAFQLDASFGNRSNGSGSQSLSESQLFGLVD